MDRGHATSNRSLSRMKKDEKKKEEGEKKERREKGKKRNEFLLMPDLGKKHDHGGIGRGKHAFLRKIWTPV